MRKKRKEKTMKRSISLVLVFAMVLAAMLSVIPSAETNSPVLKVSKANLEFADTVYLFVAVDYTSVYSSLDEAKENVTLKITNDVTGITSTLTPDESIVLANHVCFKYTDLGAKNMGDQLTIQAYAGNAKSGDAKTYSVLEYALKAKGSSTTLDAVCEAMIAYGDAAQTAWDWKSQATYDLSKDWGLVLFGGAASKKQIGEVGATVTAPAANSELGASAVLYGADFKKANGSITVKEGVSRYFYLGSNLTNYNLDFTIGSIATGTVIIDGATASSSSAATTTIYSTIAGGASLTSSTGSKSWSVTSSAKEVANDYASIVEVDGEKCLQWMVDDNASKSGQINGTNGLPTGGKTVFTMSFTIGKVAGKKLIGGPRFRGSVNGSNMNGSPYSWAQNGTNGIKLWSQDNLAVTFSDGEFKTIHMVVDPENSRISCYVDSAFLGDYVPTGNNKKLLETSTGYRLDWTSFAGGAQMNIKRVVITMGNIFE